MRDCQSPAGGEIEREVLLAAAVHGASAVRKFDLQNDLQNGRSYYLPRGIYSVVWTGDGEWLLNITQVKDIGNVGSASERYFPVFLADDGTVIETPPARRVAVFNSGIKLLTYRYKDKRIANCQSLRVGIGVMDLNGRIVNFKAAAAALTGAKVLPLPVIGEPLNFKLPGMDGAIISTEDFRGKY